MTIFRFDLLGCAVLLLSAAPSVAAPDQAGPTDCSSIDPFAVRKCVGARIERKELLLEATYKRAMQAVRKNFARYGQSDNRSNPVYLTRSQAAWKQYVDSDCKVQAAFGGGSNSSISDREMYCYEDAVDKRIELLRQLADETLNVG
jgi:uncharacterized protein YecT (DUF1311 family)